MEKKNRKSTLALWGILITAGLVLAGIELLSGVKHWSVVPTGKGAIDQAISPDETLLVVLNAGENSLSFIDLKTKIPFNKLYLPLEPLLPPAEGEKPSYVLSSVEFSGDGSELLVTCVDGRFFVVDPVLQEMRSTGKALEPGLTLLGKGKVGKGVFALDRAIGKLSLLGASGEVPVVLTQVPLVASAIDFRPKTTCGSCREFLVTLAYQVEGSGRLSLVEVDSSSLEVTQELSIILPAGATFGDIRRGDEGSIVSVTYLDGGFDFLWVNNDGTIEEQEGEPLPGPEGGKIFRLCKSGMYLAHIDKGLFTLLTFGKDAKPLRLDMAPGGFDGAELRSMSAYPEQADSFASAIGPHEMLLGVPGWEGVVVFDSSGQSILGFGNNNNTTPPCCGCDKFRYTELPVHVAVGQVLPVEFYMDCGCTDDTKTWKCVGAEVVEGQDYLRIQSPLPQPPTPCPGGETPTSEFLIPDSRAVFRITCDTTKRTTFNLEVTGPAVNEAIVRYYCDYLMCDNTLFYTGSMKYSQQMAIWPHLIEHICWVTGGNIYVEEQTIYVEQGSTHTFKAVNAGTAEYEPGDLSWWLDEQPVGSDETVTVGFPLIGGHTLKVQSSNGGNDSKSVHVEVVGCCSCSDFDPVFTAPYGDPQTGRYLFCPGSPVIIDLSYEGTWPSNPCDGVSHAITFSDNSGGHFTYNPESSQLACTDTEQVTVSADASTPAGSYTITVYCDNSNPIEFHVDLCKVTLLYLVPAQDLVLGEDLAVHYSVEYPYGGSFSGMELEVCNAAGTRVFLDAALPVVSGTYTATWQDAKWNQPPNAGSYTNPRNGPYTVRITGRKGENLVCESEKTINTKLVIGADITDTPGPGNPAASRAAGVADLSNILTVSVICNGQNYEFTNTQYTLTDIAHGKHLTVDYHVLNNLDDGFWLVSLRNVRDDIGNFAGIDCEWGVDLR